MDIDVTFLLQLGLFLVLLVTLNGLLFKPFLRVMEARHDKIHGAAQDISHLLRSAEEDREAYLQRIREARAKAQAAREEVVSKGREEEREKLAAVRAEIADSLNQTRNQIQQQQAEARQALDGEVDALSRSLASKLLGRELSQ